MKRHVVEEPEDVHNTRTLDVLGSLSILTPFGKEVTVLFFRFIFLIGLGVIFVTMSKPNDNLLDDAARIRMFHDRALVSLKEAQSLESKRDLQGAIHYYESGLSDLLSSMKLMSDPKKKKIAKDTIEVYMTRAERIKERLKHEDGTDWTPDDYKNNPFTKNLDPKLVQAIHNEIVAPSASATFSSISGLDDVKQVLYEIVILPTLRPEIFDGLRAPPKGVVCLCFDIFIFLFF